MHAYASPRTVAAAVLLCTLTPALGGAQALDPNDLSGLRPREIGPAVVSGRIVDMAVVEKDTRVFYVASATGGVWKTTDNGVRFAPVFYREATHSVGDIAVSQVDTSIVWVGHRGAGQPAEQLVGRRRLQVHRRRQPPGATWGCATARPSGASCSAPTTRTRSTWRPWATCGAPTRSGASTSPPTAATSWRKILYVDEETGAVDVALDPSNPRDRLRRHVPAAAAAVGLPRRRTGERALQVHRRRRAPGRSSRTPGWTTGCPPG